MPQYLFLFTISPVQAFIEQARKTQDLYAGSRILSTLVEYAMEQTKSHAVSCDFIFPTTHAPSKPNRFIALVSAKETGIQKLGDNVQKAVSSYFIKDLGQRVLELYPPSKSQLADFLKIYWVANKYDANSSYKAQIKSVESNLGAVKNVRYFNQFPEKGRKCSLDGQYNVKFYRLADGEKENERLFNKKLFHRDLLVVDSKKDFKKLPISKLRPGEGISAVSMLKRLYAEGNKQEFESTSNIALLDTLEQLSEERGAEELLNEFVCCAEQGISDWRKSTNGQLFYEENLTSYYFRKQGLPTGGLRCAQDKLSEIYRYAQSSGKRLSFSKYYAILLFDADSMGKKLEKCKSAEEHKLLSGLLASFASFAKAYIDAKGLAELGDTAEISLNKKGRTVYAGGDDFLGFINLNYLFEALKVLRAQFDKRVNDVLGEEHEHLKLTFSAGIAIAHYKTPLGEVLSWARKMEKKAKSVLHEESDNIKKDAFALAILKRSGEIHDTVWRWRDAEANWPTEVFTSLINSLKGGKLSKTFIKNLNSEVFKTLDEKGRWGQKAEDNGLVEDLNNILQHQLEYFMLRAKAEGVSKREIESLSGDLYSLYQSHTVFDLSPLNFLNMLNISEFISRHINPTTSEASINQSEKVEA